MNGAAMVSRNQDHGEERIRAVQLSAQIGAVRLEKLGMRHSGGNVTPKLKKFYGLPRSATHDEVIAKLKEERDALDKIIFDGNPPPR